MSADAHERDAARLADLVKRTERRLELLDVQDAASRATALALALFAGSALASRLEWWRVPVSTAGAGALLLVVVFVLAGLARRRSRAEQAAARIDAVYRLDDRVRSALAYLGEARPGESPLGGALVSDAARAAEGADPRRAVAYERPAWLAPLAAAALAAVVVVALPQRWLATADASADGATGDIRAAGEDLEARSLEVARAADPRAERVRALAKEQADLGKELQRDGVSARDALAKLSSLDERISKEQKALGSGAREELDRTRSRMESALDAASKSGEAGDRSEAAGSQESAGKGEGKAMAEKAREAAAAARDGKLGAAEKEALAGAAKQLASELAGASHDEQLQSALDAMADGDVSAEDLESLAAALEGAEGRADGEEAAAQLKAANRAAKQKVAGKGGDGAGPFAGHGSTNEHEGAPYAPEDMGSTMETSKDRPTDRGEYEAKYDSRLIDEHGDVSRAHGQLQGTGRGTSLFVQAAPGAAAATVPYQQVFPQYRRSAERSIERSGVPPEMRGVVRDYFDSINPR